MKMIRLKTIVGADVAIAPHYVVAVYSARANPEHCYIQVIGNNGENSIYVDASLGQVVSAINEALEYG